MPNEIALSSVYSGTVPVLSTMHDVGGKSFQAEGRETAKAKLRCQAVVTRLI